MPLRQESLVWVVEARTTSLMCSSVSVSASKTPSVKCELKRASLHTRRLCLEVRHDLQAAAWEASQARKLVFRSSCKDSSCAYYKVQETICPKQHV